MVVKVLPTHREFTRSAGTTYTQWLMSNERAWAGRASGPIPEGLAFGLVLPQPVPRFAGESIEIEYHATGGYREFANQTLSAVHAGAPRVNERELPLFYSQDGNVRDSAGRDVA